MSTAGPREKLFTLALRTGRPLQPALPLAQDLLDRLGGLTASHVYPREVAKRGLQLNAKSVIAVHNHPSGEATPSSADQLLTSQLRRSLATLDIELLDHLIVAGGVTVSAGGI